MKIIAKTWLLVTSLRIVNLNNTSIIKAVVHMYIISAFKKALLVLILDIVYNLYS